ncbi:hypothetical protein ACH4FX_42115 [Streptomyces sp. NPDC018019]|uniref:hypothetical protein n=1 Tax=Streptomyces sp. NPDC018019 TaxID=3365030 RepID=UPI00379E6CB0
MDGHPVAGRNFDGESLQLTSDASNLSSGINDHTSSIVITDGTTQQQGIGNGASNQSNTAQVNGTAFTEIDQSNANVAVNFSELW